MLRPARQLSSACVAAALTLVVAALAVPPAAAEEVEGTITVVVDRDVDDDGAYDDRVDQPQPGVEITVTDPSGVVAAGVTDAAGQFVVVPAERGLSGGRYFVVADIPATLALTPVQESRSFQPLSTTVDVTAGDQLVRLGVAAQPVPEPAPEPDPLVPAPPREPAPSPAAAASEPRFAVGDRVWRDSDRDGRQDEQERPSVDTTVQLLDGVGGLLRSTRTDEDGRYVFDDLPAGLYSVRFAGIAAEYRLSPADVGNEAGDSDPDYTGVTPPFELAVGGSAVRATREEDGVRADHINATVDAGIAPLTYAVASVVWQDRDGNGRQDADEPPGAARVTLIDTAQNQAVAALRSDDAGRVVFAALPAGEYRLRFSELGEHRQLTTARVGTSTLDSDPDRSSGLTRPFRLQAGGPGLVPAADAGRVDADFVETTHNAGVVGSYAISNRVWHDADGDGLVSPGEKGVKGVQVGLVDAAGDVVATTTTTASGAYRFRGLTAGEYRLRFSRIPPGLHFTTPGVGDDRSLDSDVYSDARTAPIAVGEDHPVEDAVAAGLTRSGAAAPTTSAPVPATAAVAASAPAAPLSSTGGSSAALLVAGSLMALLGTALVLGRRLRR